ncbi:uncharacterized protein B0H18DRAFT_1033003 [Fomitopsis serialis]|uniref:uncharacterized protein n=1 Tax=Fomitopsis serialis TaxID=139415 RepID=UPI002008A47B|nr:uncharacterized protein B0H18DRAFT_1033003 [Neoantrodia serialis]KAH9917961.1 hypothetical protein B0H18DRAFT_1033003 [Neoantrodia serialis]
MYVVTVPKDHHCYWLGDKCIGHRTYAAFLHLLTCIVLLSVTSPSCVYKRCTSPSPTH